MVGLCFEDQDDAELGADTRDTSRRMEHVAVKYREPVWLGIDRSEDVRLVSRENHRLAGPVEIPRRVRVIDSGVAGRRFAVLVRAAVCPIGLRVGVAPDQRVAAES